MVISRARHSALAAVVIASLLTVVTPATAVQLRAVDLITRQTLLTTPDDPHAIDTVSGSMNRVSFTQSPHDVVQVWNIGLRTQTHTFAGIQPTLHGDILAYVHDAAPSPGGFSNDGIAVVNLNTGTVQRPTTSPAGNPFVFGHEVLYQSGGRLFLYDALTQTHGISFPNAHFGTLSADYIAFVVGPGFATIGEDSPGSTIGIYNRRTDQTSFLANAPFNVFFIRPYIYDDLLAFEAQYFDPLVGFTHSDIFVFDLMSGGVPITVTNTSPPTVSIRPSVFGKQVAFETREVIITGPGFSGFTKKSDIFIYNASDATLHNFTDNPDFVIAENSSIFDDKLAYSVQLTSPTAVPEPSTLFLLSSALAVLILKCCLKSFSAG